MLDSKLNFDMHLKEKISIVNNGIALLKKLIYFIPRKPLLSVCKEFLRPHLDYCDIIYDKPSNEKFIDTLELIQYNATLAMAGAIEGTSKEKLYNELGLEYLRDRRWMRELGLFHKIFNLKSPIYLYDLITPVTRSYASRNKSFNCRTEYFMNYFVPNVINELNKLDIKITNVHYIILLNILYLLSFIGPLHFD